MNIKNKYFGVTEAPKFINDCDLCGSKENVQKITEFDLKFLPSLKDKDCCTSCLQQQYINVKM